MRFSCAANKCFISSNESNATLVPIHIGCRIEEEKYVSVQLRRKYRCKFRALVVGSWRAAKILRFTWTSWWRVRMNVPKLRTIQCSYRAEQFLCMLSLNLPILLRKVRMPWTLSLHLPYRNNLSILLSLLLLYRCSFSSCIEVIVNECSLFMPTHKYQIAVNSRVSSELCLHHFVESCCFILF